MNKSEAMDLILFIGIRERLFAAIKRLFDAGETHGKHYEGTFKIEFPNYMEDERDIGLFTIMLDCYVIGPNRHYEWSAQTLGEAVAQCGHDVDLWIAESDDSLGAGAGGGWE